VFQVQCTLVDTLAGSLAHIWARDSLESEPGSKLLGSSNMTPHLLLLPGIVTSSAFLEEKIVKASEIDIVQGDVLGSCRQ